MYLALAQCPRHGYVKGKIRVKKTADGRVFAVKTTKKADADAVAQIRGKKEQIKAKRRERRGKKKEVSAAENQTSVNTGKTEN